MYLIALNTMVTKRKVSDEDSCEMISADPTFFFVCISIGFFSMPIASKSDCESSGVIAVKIGASRAEIGIFHWGSWRSAAKTSSKNRASS